jgi:FtsP/CotA-like multicopper oxidase with cupredoxin domain
MHHFDDLSVAGQRLRRRSRIAVVRLLLGGLCAIGMAAAPAAQLEAAQRDPCPRPAPGSPLPEARELRSRDGLLEVELAIRNYRAPGGAARYCYVLADGTPSPTLRLRPGDLLVIRLSNRLAALDELRPGLDLGFAAAPPAAHAAMSHGAMGEGPGDACKGTAMNATSTNLHFHGLSVPPTCHQDEVLHTSIQAADAPFEYRFRIPPEQPPGLYWYHPHIHGFSSPQVGGGASGALIVEGIEREKPDLAGLAERLLVIRDQELLHADATGPPAPGNQAVPVDREGDALNSGTGGGRPARDLSVNFVPVPYPDYPMASVSLRPGERQLWRVLNASAVTYLDLSAMYKRGPRFRPQWLGVVAIDGVPIRGSGGRAVEWRDRLFVSPGARVEFILVGPPAGVPAMLVTRSVDTGEGGENDPYRPLLSILADEHAPAPAAVLPAPAGAPVAASRPWLGSVAPVRERRLYFSEDPPDAKHPQGPGRFYLTVEGRTPAVFDPARREPDIVVHQGDVEDWIIENRSAELHAFHIHQLHFEVVDWGGLAVNEQFLRDTINVPFYRGTAKTYPSVRLRMDFRDPGIVGTFVYHCHVLDHEDAGMMGTVRVEP